MRVQGYLVPLLVAIPAAVAAAAVPSPAIIETPPAATSERTPYFGWTGLAGATYTWRVLRLDGALILGPGQTTERRVRIGPLPDGTYRLALTQRTSAGESPATLSAPVAIDTIAPGAPVVTDQSGGPAGSPRFAVTADAGSTVAWEVSGPRSVSGTGTQIAVPDLPDGIYLLAVTAADAAANTARTELTFVVDRSAPAAPHLMAFGAPRTRQTVARLRWSAEPGGTFEWRVLKGDRVVLGPTRTVARGARVRGLARGRYRFEVLQQDGAGNRSPAVAATLVVLRGTAATAELADGARIGTFRPAYGSTIHVARPLMRWRVPDPGSVTRYQLRVFRGKSLVHVAYPRTSSYRPPARVLRSGSRYTWEVRVRRRGRTYVARPVARGNFRVVLG